MSKYTILIARLQQEIKNIERTVQRATSQAEKAVANHDEDYYDAVALNLQKFYMGTERIMIEVAREIDAYVPSGADWHKQLLQQMALENGDIRPALLSSQAYQMLEMDYRGFRHVATHLYAFDLKPDRIRELVSNLPECLNCLAKDIQDFCDFLQLLSQSLHAPAPAINLQMAVLTKVAVCNFLEGYGENLPDGSRVFEGQQWRLLLKGNVLTITNKPDKREILRVEGENVISFNLLPEDQQKLEQLQRAFGTMQPQQETQQNQGLNL